MIKKLGKIVIVGGGSAGWMTAAALIKTFPNKHIEVVESPAIPIVGVGESTLGQINDYLKYLDIDEKEFMRQTDASFKLSIKFTDFYKKDSGSFHYPFGVPCLEDTLEEFNDWFYKKYLYPDTPVQDFVRCYYPSMALVEQNKFSLNENGEFYNYDPDFHSAYHFDAHKFSEWLRNSYCLKRGVIHTISNVDHIEVDDDGIKFLKLATGDTISADLFIDCTGFRSLLLGKTLAEPFTSYSDILPNNRAWATRISYIDPEREIEPYTNCTAHDNGWIWNICLWTRLGTGYVYSDKYTDPESALEQFKNYLCSNKMTIPRTRDQVEQLKFNDISMRVGIHERTWVKNCVAIGLSAGFIEPLESNGLFSVHEFLFKLLKALGRDSISQWDIDSYNSSCLNIFRNFSEFVALHYALSCRSDTAYWIDNQKRSYSPKMVSMEPDTFQGFKDLKDRKMFSNRIPFTSGITFISTGMNYPIIDSITLRLRENRDKISYKEKFSESFKMFEKKKNYWSEQAKKELSVYEFLKRRIHD